MAEQVEALVNSRFKYPKSVHRKVKKHRAKLQLENEDESVTIEAATIDLIKLGIKSAGI